jgi:hypothetical protein
MVQLPTFDHHQIRTLNQAVAVAEDLVSNAYKMSTSQWLHQRYDIKTLKDLSPDEVIHGPFAQLIRYEGHRPDTSLSSAAYDFYKVCIQDHTIIATLDQVPDLQLFPFTLYISTHELIHIVRFSKFLANFDIAPENRIEEESRVHQRTREILNDVSLDGIDEVLEYYRYWDRPFEGLKFTDN